MTIFRVVVRYTVDTEGEAEAASLIMDHEPSQWPRQLIAVFASTTDGESCV